MGITNNRILGGGLQATSGDVDRLLLKVREEKMKAIEGSSERVNNYHSVVYGDLWIASSQIGVLRRVVRG